MKCLRLFDDLDKIHVIVFKTSSFDVLKMVNQPTLDQVRNLQKASECVDEIDQLNK